MAIYHLHAQVIGRSGGRSAIASMAYRSGQKLTSEATGEIYDYKVKGRGVDYAGMVMPDNAPEWAYERNRLWNEVEKKEDRKNSQFCREFEISLPDGATLEDHKKLVEKFIKDTFIPLGLGADYAIHNSKKGQNGHAHIGMLIRGFDQDQPDAWAKNKDRRIHDHEWFKGVRKSWENTINEYLIKHNLPTVSCETLEAQGIKDRLPQIHQGVKANAMEKKGKKVDRKRINELPDYIELKPEDLILPSNNPDLARIKLIEEYALIKPEKWEEHTSKYNVTMMMYNQKAQVETIRTYATERREKLIADKKTYKENIDELNLQEPKEKITDLFSSKDFDKRHEQWKKNISKNADLYNGTLDEGLQLEEAMKDTTGTKVLEYGKVLKKKLTNFGKWLEEQTTNLLETSDNFIAYRIIREAFQKVDPIKKEELSIIREQERERKINQKKSTKS